MIRTLRGILRLLRNAVERGTVPEIFKYSAQSLRHEMLGARAEYLRHPVRSFPLIARRHTTDHRVFAQIFVEREYTPVDDWNNVEVVVDCGANVGYSSAYFLTAFPESRVIAVEPDPENYRVLTRNLEPYGARAVALHAALWSRPGQVELQESDYRGGGAWSRQVGEPAGRGSESVEAIDIPSLMERFHLPRISLLKVDIEGSRDRGLLGADQRVAPPGGCARGRAARRFHFGPATPAMPSRPRDLR